MQTHACSQSVKQTKIKMNQSLNKVPQWLSRMCKYTCCLARDGAASEQSCALVWFVSNGVVEVGSDDAHIGYNHGGKRNCLGENVRKIRDGNTRTLLMPMPL